MKAVKILVPFDFDYQYGFFLKEAYFKALQKEGTEVLPLLYDTTSLKRKIEKADALFLPGGLGDLDPQLYGESKNHESVKVIKERCEFEWQLLEQFLPTEKPLLAVCWGFQMLNVFCGGSLYQHLPRDYPSSIQHEQIEDSHTPTHLVHFKAGSHAESLFGVRSLKVNSTHHQGIKELGKTCRAEGWAEDDLLECFYLEGHPFAWAVEWHPERLVGDPIIPAFLKAAQR